MICIPTVVTDKSAYTKTGTRVKDRIYNMFWMCLPFV